LRAGVHIIPKIADFLYPKIIFCPNLKKMPPIKKTFSNSTNTFSPNCPKLGKKLPPIVKNNPN